MHNVYRPLFPLFKTVESTSSGEVVIYSIPRTTTFAIYIYLRRHPDKHKENEINHISGVKKKSIISHPFCTSISIEGGLNYSECDESSFQNEAVY